MSNFTLSKSMQGYQQAVYNLSSYSHDMPSTEHQRDVASHLEAYHTLSTNNVITADTLSNLTNNNYKLWVTVINTEPYNKPDLILVEVTLMYVNKPISLYISKQWYDSLFAVTEPQPELYHYEMLYRPLSPFCQPKNHIAYDDSKGRHGIISYNRPLTADELEEYELRSWTA